MSIRLGTSSFSSKSWIGPFYPEGTKAIDFIRYYSQKFNTVEIDSSYYGIPRQTTVQRWYDQTPDDFLFTTKFPRLIVHGGEGFRPDSSIILNTDKVLDETNKFLETVSILENKLGPLLIQFPYFNKSIFPSYQEFFDRLENYLRYLPDNFNYAIEIRNKYWLNQEFARICNAYNLTPALTDHPWMPGGSEVLNTLKPEKNKFAYIRLLGDRKEIEAITESWDKEYINRDENLHTWSQLIKEISDGYDTILVYSNNHFSGHAPETVRKLEALLNG